MTITKNKINHSSLLLVLYVGVLSGILLPCFSCRQSGAAGNNVYYDSFFSPLTREFKKSHDKKYIDKADSIYRNTTAPSQYLKYKWASFRAWAFYESDVADSIAGYLDTSIAILEHSGLADKYPLQYARELNGRGDRYFMENQLDKAFQFYYKSRNIRVNLKDDTCALANETYHLGMVTYRQERYKESADYFKQSYAENCHCEPDFDVDNRKQEELNNTALAYTRLNMYDSALSYYGRSADLITVLKRTYTTVPKEVRLLEEARGVVMGNIAKIYIAAKQYDTAEKLLRASIAINEQPLFENKDAMYSNMQLAELYYLQHRIGEIPAILNGLEKAMDSIENKPVEMRWNHMKYLYLKETGKPVEALKYLESYEYLRDSISKRTEAIKKTDYGGLLKDQATQYQITLLKKDNQLSKLYLFVTIGIVGVALIIIGLVYYSYRRGRINIITLTALNKQINEQKAQLEETMVHVKESNDDKDRILRIVAHDLRTPINGIMIISDLVMQDEEDKEKKESLSMIITAAKNLLHLTNELLEFSGNGKLVDKGEIEHVNLNELVRQTIGLLKFKAQEKKQVIAYTPVPYPVEADVYRDKISRVVSNLVSNALKFSKEGALIKVSLSSDNEKAIIKVEDFGIGIPENMLSHIFEPFTSAKRHGTSGERSYGLGLSICKQIIDEHKGRIWVESQEGQGSIFYAELPLKRNVSKENDENRANI